MNIKETHIDSRFLLAITVLTCRSLTIRVDELRQEGIDESDLPLVLKAEILMGVVDSWKFSDIISALKLTTFSN